MEESTTSSNPNDIHLPPPQPPPATSLPPPEISKPNPAGLLSAYNRPLVRVTSEFDSDSTVFFHKVSCKFLDNLAKLKLSFQNNRLGEVSSPQLGFFTKYFSVLYDIDSKNALVRGSFNVGNQLKVLVSRDVKEEQGDISMIASLVDPSYKLELSSPLPLTVLPKASMYFPFGEVSLDKISDEAKEGSSSSALSLNGILRSQAMNGILTASVVDEEMRLRYSYKDEEMTLIPIVSLPSNALSLGFKRRFTPLDKLSYWYHFNSNDWNAVFKRKVGKDLKFKVGYDSEVRLGWASIWVGDEAGTAKTAPMKMKVQVMLQVPQDDLANSVVLLKVRMRMNTQPYKLIHVLDALGF